MRTSAPFKSERARELYLARYELRAKLWPVPSEERVVNTSFGQTFVRVSGPAQGAPVLLLPGIGSTGLTLGPLVRGLSGPYRTYVIDNIHDVGRSIATRHVTSAEEFANWFDEVRRALGLDVVNIGGLSYGGWICAQYALRFPQFVRRVVLLAPAGTTAHITFEFIRRAILTLIPVRAFMRNFMGWIAPSLRLEDAAAFDEMVEDGYLATQLLERKKTVPPMPLTDAQWAQYKSRTLFLAGSNEVVFPPQAAITKLARVAPHIEAELIENVGHDFIVVRPDEVNRRVLSFLNAE